MEQPKSKRAAQAEATRDHLLETARQVFSERGYHSTNVAAITTAAKTAHGTFYLYFRNKEDVFTAVVQGAVLELYDTMSNGRPEGRGRDFTQQNLRNILETYVKHAGIWRCMLEAVFTNSNIETMWREMRAGFVNQMALTIRTYQAKGRVRDTDPVIAANAIAAMLEWSATTSFVLRMPPVDDVDFDATVEVLSDLCYHALSTSVLARPDA